MSSSTVTISKSAHNHLLHEADNACSLREENERLKQQVEKMADRVVTSFTMNDGQVYIVTERGDVWEVQFDFTTAKMHFDLAGEVPFSV